MRDLKKGQFAWKHLRDSIADDDDFRVRLLAHSIADDSALRSHLPAVKEFLRFGRRYYPQDVTTAAQLEDVLVIYVTTMCYCQDLHPIQGSLTMNGVAYLMPEYVRQMPRAWRESKSWSVLTIVKEGQDRPWPLKLWHAWSSSYRSSPQARLRLQRT